MRGTNRLRELRTEKGISQRELARQVGLLPQTYSNYENGMREADYETVIMLADYFNVTTDYLLGRVEKPGESVGDDGDDVKVALFGGAGEVTDEMWEEVLGFVDYVKEKQRKKRDEQS